MLRARIRVDGRLAGVCKRFWGRQWRSAMGAGGQERTEDTARGARGPGWRELVGTFSWPDGGSVANGRRQVGSGMARNRARARLTFSCHGQLLGRWRVSRRAERVIRPARAKTLRRRVLVVTIRSPRPMRAVQRARLWAITCTASQAALAAKRPEGRWFSPTWKAGTKPGPGHLVSLFSLAAGGWGCCTTCCPPWGNRGPKTTGSCS